MIYQVRVIFGDTDQLGVVYYGNYMRYFEGARAAFLRACGRSHKDIQAMGVALPVVEAHCRYRRPAHYEDILSIHLEVTDVQGASMRFDYRVQRERVLIADGYTRHAVVDASSGRPRRIPRGLLDVLELASEQPGDRIIH